MIKNSEPLSMTEATEYVKDSKSEVVGFIKKFIKPKPEQAKELKKKLEEMDNMKVREEHIVKIIDLMPETSEDLNKIFVGVSLDEDETKKILDILKSTK